MIGIKQMEQVSSIRCLLYHLTIEIDGQRKEVIQFNISFGEPFHKQVRFMRRTT